MGRQGWSHWNANHVPRDDIPEPDPGIEAVADAVDQAGLDDNFELDLRIGLQETLHDRLNNDHVPGAQSVEPKLALRSEGRVADFLVGTLNIAKRWANPFEVVQSGLSQGDAPRRPIEETGA